MIRSCICFCILVALAVPARAQAPARPLRLIAEAEDFTVVKGAWQRVPYRENYFAGTFAITFLSRMACLGAPEQVETDAIAEQRVDIPQDGEFHVLARYEQPYNFSVAFTIEVEQAGKSVFKQTYGRLTDPKIWAFNGHKRVPMERYGWGGTDNIVWQDKGTVTLTRGPATIRLSAGPQLDGAKPRALAARRHIDVICLTNDLAGMEAQKKTNYLELDGWLVQDGDLYVRVTNPRAGLGPCIPVLAPVPEGQHSPYYIHVRDWPATRVLKSGRLVDATSYTLAGPRSSAVRPELLAPLLDPAKYAPVNPKKLKAAPTDVPDEEYLQPGDTSGWVPLGQALDALNNGQWYPRAQYKNKVDGLHLHLEFAIPDGKGGLKPVREITVRGTPAYFSDVTFEMPGNVAAEPVIRTQLEALRWLRAEVEKFRKGPAARWLRDEDFRVAGKGPPVRRFPIYGLLHFSGATSVPGPIGEEATKLALALGDNTMVGRGATWAKKLGVPERRTMLVAHWPVGTAAKHYAAAEKAGHADDIKIVSYGDEIHIAPLAPAKGQEAEFDARFVAWLQQRQVDGAPQAIYTKDQKDRWYYYSMLYATEAGIDRYVQETKFLESKSKDILTGANYSPHANYLVTELQYVRPFKARAMTMPWGEDYIWQIPEFSTQAAGYLVSGFRAGAKYHNLPIMMYVMPHSPGTTPRDFRLSFYTCIAHGTRLINYFCASPGAVNGTENYVATNDLPMWRALHTVSHEARVFEDYVLDGKVRPARVGLLLSSVDEILTGDTNFKGGIHNAERKSIYYALRHAQVPVDFLTEDDVIEGLARDYQVIYVTQQHLHSRAVKALRQWAEAGGTVVALCGGGMTNEFGAPNPEAHALYGLKEQKLDKDPALPQVLLKQDLPPYQPLERVSWGGLDVPVLLWKQTLVPADGQVLGTYQSGGPAIVSKTHGKGRAVLCGFFPAMAYVRGALPLRPVDRGATDAAYSHFLPTNLDAKLRKKLVDDVLPANFVRPVECSEPLVETTCIDTPARLAVPLMNYSGKAIEKLHVRIAGLAGAKTVRSVERGALPSEVKDGATIVTLPLDVADMLLIER
jgi:hypothetical protein